LEQSEYTFSTHFLDGLGVGGGGMVGLGVLCVFGHRPLFPFLSCLGWMLLERPGQGRMDDSRLDEHKGLTTDGLCQASMGPRVEKAVRWKRAVYRDGWWLSKGPFWIYLMGIDQTCRNIWADGLDGAD
jgi:hypothetical protein